MPPVSGGQYEYNPSAHRLWSVVFIMPNDWLAPCCVSHLPAFNLCAIKLKTATDPMNSTTL